MKTINAKVVEFIAANEKSPVVSGYVVGLGGEGAYYTLRNGSIFYLTAEQCGQANPRWDLQP